MDIGDDQLRNKPGFSDMLTQKILNIADRHDIKINFHIEPYKGRNAYTVKEDIKYIITKYGKHNAFYRDPTRNNLPYMYIYDSYHTPENQWAEVFERGTTNSIRETPYDAVVIALLVTDRDKNLVTKGHFDGFYTYFATDGFTYGSTFSIWKHLSQFAIQNNKIFIPSVGPGYADTRIRPWNFSKSKR